LCDLVDGSTCRGNHVLHLIDKGTTPRNNDA
jgi:hypothetical protein